MADRRVFRATSAPVTMIGAGAVAVFLLGDALLRGGVGQTLLLAPWILLVLWIVYAAVFTPRVETDAAGITVVNVLRTARVPWGRVTDLSTRWQVTLQLDDGSRVAAFGGPSPRRSRSRDQRETPYSDMDLIRREWEDAREADVPGGPVQRRWNVGVVVSLAVLVVWAVAAVMTVGTGA